MYVRAIYRCVGARSDVLDVARCAALLGCVPFLLAPIACAPRDAEAPFDMAAYLEDMAVTVDPVRNRFANSALLQVMELLPSHTCDRRWWGCGRKLSQATGFLSRGWRTSC